MSGPNALDSALILLAQASTALERTAKPDVEEAKEKSKRATKILEAAHVLMSCGIYTVADQPDRFVDTATHEIRMPPVSEVVESDLHEETTAEEIPAEPMLFPSVLTEFDGWDETEQLNQFEQRLENLRVSLEHPDEQDLAQWDAAWGADRKQAFTKLLVAEAREPRTFAVPDEAELDAWRAQFTDPLPDTPEHLVQWSSWDADEQLRQFEALLNKLEEAGVEDGLKRKSWKKAVLPWQDLFVENRGKAWDKLWVLYYGPRPVTWEVPEDSAPRQDPAAAEEIPVDVDPFETEGGAE